MSVENPHLHSQVSACVGSETVYHHVLERVFDALTLSLCASVAHNDVCVGLSACFSRKMWATRIFNLCTKPLQALLSHLLFFLHPARSLNWYHLKVTHAQQGWRPLTLRSCLRVILNLLFFAANERGHSSAPLSRGAVIYCVSLFVWFFSCRAGRRLPQVQAELWDLGAVDHQTQTSLWEK